MKTLPRNLPRSSKQATVRAQGQLARVTVALRRIGRKAKGGKARTY
jgi:hypothetical protein